MAPTSWSPFEEDSQVLRKIIRFSPPPVKPNENLSTDVGLRILIQLSQDNSNNVVVAKTTLKSKPTSRNHQTYESSSFLKWCHLCKTSLRLDKDVFMYRGDQGFCSLECRNRQIYLDETKEIEASNKKIQSTFQRCQPELGDAYCETRALLEQFRQRHNKPRSRQNRRVTLAS